MSLESQSKKPLQPSSSPLTKEILPLRPKILPKYLRRNLKLNASLSNLIALNIKRTHIRKIIEAPLNDESTARELEKTHKKCFKKKLLKNLTHLTLSSFYEKYWIENLKNSKKLISIICCPYEDCSNPMLLTRYLGRLGKYLQFIASETLPFSDVSFVDLRNFFKTIGSFSKLRVYSLNGDLESKFKEKGFLCLQKYLNRLPHLQDFFHYFHEASQFCLRKIDDQRRVFPKITKSCFHFDVFGQTPERELNSFSFDSFPKLKDLRLNGLPTFNSFSVGLFLAQRFRSFSSLHSLKLTFTSSKADLIDLFKGFLELPNLSSFTLGVDYLTESYWETLSLFVQKQTNLNFLELFVFKLDLENNEILENQFSEDFLASLSHKSKLQYLSITSQHFHLPNLSQGLKQLVGTTQLKSFELVARKNSFSLSHSNQSPLEGLCEFLLRNKNSLCKLGLDLPLFREQEFNEEISMAISQLSQLKSFSFNLSAHSLKDAASSSYLNGWRKNHNNVKKAWDPCLHKILPQLPNLEALRLIFQSFHDCPPEDRRWIGRAFKALPSLKKLREFEFFVPHATLSKTEVTHINSVLDNLTHLVELDLETFDYETDCQFEKIQDKVKTLKTRQARRMNLSFSDSSSI